MIDLVNRIIDGYEIESSFTKHAPLRMSQSLWAWDLHVHVHNEYPAAFFTSAERTVELGRSRRTRCSSCSYSSAALDMRARRLQARLSFTCALSPSRSSSAVAARTSPRLGRSPQGLAARARFRRQVGYGGDRSVPCARLVSRASHPLAAAAPRATCVRGGALWCGSDGDSSGSKSPDGDS